MFYLVLIIFFILLSASFSSLETAFLTANPLKIFSKEKSHKNTPQIIQLFNNMNQVINTLLVGNTIANISAAILFLLYFEDKGYSFGESLLFSSIFSTLLILFFGEIFPKTFSLKYSVKIVLNFYPLFKVYRFLFSPLSSLLNFLNKQILGNEKQEDFLSREEVEFAFYQGKMDKNEEDEKNFIQKVFNLSSVKLKEIMIPLNEISALPIESGREEILKKIEEKYYSRLPIFENEIFNLIGYINILDILFTRETKEIKIQSFLKKTLFFPELKPADEAMYEMQNAKKPLAFIVDEYGAVSGMVTKEDIAELIVGNIEDEMHQEDSVIRIKNGYIMPGSENVDDLNRDYHLGIVKDNFETLSGFVTFQLHKIPEVGDFFKYNNFIYRVIQIKNRTAQKVKITREIQK
ncbi:MAG TPA: hypothetical protein DHW82_09505 [Spirochaetia bacterium]|nr:hypothetical protein [Spirochaetia bacterium]